MRTWFRAAAAVALSALLPAAAVAQPKAAEPTVEVRVRSLNDLFDKAGYLGGLFDQEDGVAQVRELVKLLSQDGKGIEGVDPARPFGAYAILTSDFAASPVVVMVPIADEARFRRMLKERLDVTPQPVGKGVETLFVPVLNEAFITFADGYLYAGRTAADVAAKNRVDPKTYFADPDGAVVSVVARLDRVPADVRALVVGQLEHQVKERRLQKADGKTPAELKLETFAFDAVVGSAKRLVDDGKELALRVYVDEKADEVSAELSLAAKAGSPLAKTFAALKGRTSRPAGIAKTKDAVIGFTGKVGLPDDLRKQFEPVLKAVFEEIAAKAGDRGVAERILDALAPTARAAAADVAVTVSGPDARGKLRLVAAAAVTGGKEIEKLAKEFGPFVPADDLELSFDVEKVGAFALHKVVIGRVDAGFEKAFGTKTLWLATSDDVVAVSVEPDGATLKAGLRAGAVPVPVAGATVALARAVPLFNDRLAPDEARALVRDAFGPAGPAGRDTVALTVDGGDRLSVRLTARGGAVKLLKAVGQFAGP